MVKKRNNPLRNCGGQESGLKVKIESPSNTHQKEKMTREDISCKQLLAGSQGFTKIHLFTRRRSETS